MLPWLMTALAAARAYGIDILDGVYNDLSDEAGFRAECEQGRDCGFDGKTLIHPSQIAAANEVFAPSAGEVENARAIIAAFELPENAGKGAISARRPHGRAAACRDGERAVALTRSPSRRSRERRAGGGFLNPSSGRASSGSMIGMPSRIG